MIADAELAAIAARLRRARHPDHLRRDLPRNHVRGARALDPGARARRRRRQYVFEVLVQ
jgi:hypothetical protein